VEAAAEHATASTAPPETRCGGPSAGVQLYKPTRVSDAVTLARAPPTSRAPTLPLLCQLSARLRAPLARAPPPPAHAGQALRRPHVAAPRSRRPIVQHGCASRLVRPATLPAALHDYMAGLPLRRLSPLAGQRALRLTTTAVVDEVLFPTTNEPAYVTTFC